MTSPDQHLILYAFFWLLRINGCVRRGRQPRLRGPEWFFDVRVSPDFYTGAGRGLLRQYWMRMLIPFAVDVPLAIAIVASGRLQLLTPLIIGLCGLIHLNHAFSVRLAERQARAFAVGNTDLTAVRLVLPLTPRRLRDYTSVAFEWTLAVCTLIALVWLARLYAAAPEPRDARFVFGVPAMMLYFQAGLLLVKRAIVDWRSAVPQTQADERLTAWNERRKYYVRICDHLRAAATASIVFWPIQLSLPPTSFNRVAAVWFAAAMGIGLVGSVWQEATRKRLARLSVLADPVRLPDLRGDAVRWPVCYEPSAPMLMLKGAHGYSINLANSVAIFSAAYLAGFAALIVVLRMTP